MLGCLLLGVVVAVKTGVVFRGRSATPMTAWLHAPWNADAERATVDPNSPALISTWLARGNVRYPNMTLTNGYAFAWTYGTARDPHYHVTQTRWQMPLDASIPIPQGARPAPGGDAHLTIYDTEHGRTHDLWLASYDAATDHWTAGVGVSYPIGGSPPPGTGAVAAGTPILALSAWPEEIKAGAINHALAFTALRVAPSYRYPAVHTDGKGDASDLPMGSWLRLPPEITPDPAWPAWVKVVFAALQQHGMFLVDTGGALTINGIDPVNGGLRWSDVGLSGADAGFPSNFPWQRLQLLEPPRQ